MDYVKIDKANIVDFSSVLPENIIDYTGVSIGAVDDGNVYGAASVSFNGEEYNIDWIYVEPSKRLMGIGRSLINEIRALTSQIGVCPIRMVINSSDGSGLYPFILSIEDDEQPIDMSFSHNRYIVSVEDYVNSPDIQKILKQPDDASFYTELFWSMGNDEIESTLSLISANFSISSEERFKESCEKKLCIVKKRNNNIEAFSLIESLGEAINVSFIYSSNPKALVALLKDIAVELEGYNYQMPIYFDAIAEGSELLAKKLFKGAKIEYIYEAEL